MMMVMMTVMMMVMIALMSEPLNVLSSIVMI